jgi:hypothetical protein
MTRAIHLGFTRAAIATGIVALLAGCEANGPRIQNVHPLGAGELGRIAPECVHPNSAQYTACLKAAEMLEKNPIDATALYLRNWQHVAFRGDYPSSGNVDPNLVLLPIDFISTPTTHDEAAAGVAVGTVMLVAIAGVAISNEMHEARITWAQRITTVTLRRIYERAGDPYSNAMMPALSEVAFRQIDSLAMFNSTHVALLAADRAGTLGSHYPTQNAPGDVTPE